jgi:hypothetical protein
MIAIPDDSFNNNVEGDEVSDVHMWSGDQNFPLNAILEFLSSGNHQNP